jgi:hypothetical protein
MTREEIQEWLTEWLADRLCVAPEDIERDRSLASLGIEQDDLDDMQSEIEDYFEESLDAGAIRLRSTPSSVTRYLCELTGTDEDDDFTSGPVRDPEMEDMLRDMGVQ